MKIKLSSLLLAFVLAGAPGLTQAATQSITTDFGTTHFFQSNGSTLGTANGSESGNPFTFSLGAFASGFTPTASNTADWTGNFRQLTQFQWLSPVDGANDSYATAAWNLITGGSTYTTNSAFNSANLSDVASGSLMYLWVYNTQSLVPGAEWALLHDADWVMPALSKTTDDTYTWTFDQLTGNPTAILGGWGVSGDNVQEAVGGNFALTGPANYTTGDQGFQTAGFQNVPEPSGAILIGIAGMLAIFRRRNVKHS